MPGVWHNKMESLFDSNKREVKFCYQTRYEICTRIADVILSNDSSLEIQHSYITDEEIIKRKNDWGSFGKDIIWLIDGNTKDVIYNKLSNGHYLFQFDETWKYKSFLSYEYILVNIDNNIYRISPKMVKNKMIEITEFKCINEVVLKLKEDPKNIWNLWKEEDHISCKMIVHQKGAGNGKTFSIWKSICENTDKTQYIIVTKQHSAKNVILEELLDQQNREEYHINNMTKYSDNLDEEPKQYVIKYTHKITNRECLVIIGTIDSFTYNLGDSPGDGSDIFTSILNNIIKYGPSKMSSNGCIRYAGESIYINKGTEIWIDEVQDLNTSYLYSMVRLMKDTYCDINIVGDKLQSLQYKVNFLSTVMNGEGLPDIKIEGRDKKENSNRRINVNGLHNKINEIINFDKYGLPEIDIAEENINKLKDYETPMDIIPSPEIYSNTEEAKVSAYVDRIIDKVRYEVDKYEYKPNNFMFIFPIMKNNLVATELETKLNEFWSDKFRVEEEYKQYAFLHKHEAGCAIDTTKSINSSRIMSIQTSKGDGREVVFVLGTTEKSLKLVSDNELNLLYESHLHVALTRAKSKIYFGLIEKNDDIHRRFRNIGNVLYKPSIRKSLQLAKIIDLINKDKIIKLLTINGIEEYKEEETGNKDSFEWTYHCIRYCAFYYSVIFNIIQSEAYDFSKFNKSQLNVILDRVSKLDIKLEKVRDYYNFLTENSGNFLPYFPVCDLSSKDIYKNYSLKIKNTMEGIQGKIKKIKDKNINFITYEIIILVHMIQLYTSKKYADTNINDIYNITHFFEIKEREKYFLEQIKHVNLKINSLIMDIKNNYCDKDDIDLEWKIEKNIHYNGQNSDNFDICRYGDPVIGFNKNYVFHLMLKTDMNKLNYWDIMVEMIFQRFLIYNPAGNEHDNDNIDLFHGKKIITYVIILEKNEYKKYDWEWDKNITEEIKIEVRDAIIKHYREHHKDLYKYYKGLKREKDNLWGKNKEFHTRYDYILNVCKTDKYPEYIRDFYIKYENTNTLKKEDKFIEALDDKLLSECNKYLNLSNEESSDSEYDSESDEEE